MLSDMILCWQWLDDSLIKTLSMTNQVPAAFGDAENFGKALAAIIALMVGAGECYLMMIGRRGMDVMKLLRIAIIAIAITLSPAIANGIRTVFLGNSTTTFSGMEGAFKKTVEGKDQEVAKMMLEVEATRANLINQINRKKAESFRSKFISELKNGNWGSAAMTAVTDGLESIVSMAADNVMGLMYAQTTSWNFIAKKVIMWAGETLMQIAYYGVLIGQRCFLAVMTIFLPFVLALSLAPPYRTAWSQWLSKYVSICLWSSVLFIVMYFLDTFILEGLKADLEALNDIVNKAADPGGGVFGGVKDIFEAGWKNISATVYTFVMYCICFNIIKKVPEVCSWIVPGGISSGWAEVAATAPIKKAQQAAAVAAVAAKAAI